MEKKAKSSLKASGNNIWNKEGFHACGLGKKNKLISLIKHTRKCIRWSMQRIGRGYADCDKWEMYHYLQTLIPEMLQDLRDTRHGSPGYLGKDYTNEYGVLVNDTCHEEWDKILNHMIFLWKESDEDTCSRENPYDEEYEKAWDEFSEKYGFLGEKLQTEAELEENRRCGGGMAVHFMNELPEYKEIWEKHFEEERSIDAYRAKCKDEALDLLKEHFYSLWD